MVALVRIREEGIKERIRRMGMYFLLIFFFGSLLIFEMISIENIAQLKMTQ